MQLNKETIQYLIEKEKTSVIEVDGIKYNQKHDNSLKTMDLVHYLETKPEPIHTKTLTGIKDFISTRSVTTPMPDMTDILVHIESYNKISVWSGEHPIFHKRDLLLTSGHEDVFNLKEDYYDFETFLIKVSTMFKESEDKKTLLLSIGTVKDGVVKTFSDDGLSQTVSAKVGLEMASEKKVPTIVDLKPFVTFNEIDQPTRKFIVRAKSGGEKPSFALFNADGGAWKLEAIANIKRWLESELPENTLIIA
ncbi:MAG: hypothetical protein A2015_02180 [Spirochaetes bacterium GWF1_31_7]|nr:MAG: hypothetical protein A2Y30_06030 [Spirochaetes bacterium GWE1_32_154]OHD50723.1 MAG: hypothetical protein A2015_02180 [Spirochaetes bacterium GWF1_31_7]OHD73148.1 MAG: hypothetical protein A2355_05005 [Spirochaetes bacterium RIFOXYB1_FULL_32_8]HBD95059.1 hypothetical protein [Spirochaetia bacterium]HBI38055.1 hypothetical protein [Spirochaetia bacterium]